MALQIAVDGGTLHDVALTRSPRDAAVWIDGREHRARISPTGRGFRVALDDHEEPMWLVVDGDVVHLHAFGRSFRAEVVDPVERALQGADQLDVASAPMPGMVVSVAVAAGEPVTLGQPLVVIESMKMQSEIVAWRDGVVERVHLAVGETFDRGAGLVGLAPEEA